MLQWQPDFQSNQSQTLCSLSPYLMLLYTYFDYNWPTEIRDKHLWKYEQTKTWIWDLCRSSNFKENDGSVDLRV